MAMSPTARSLKYLREAGWIVQIVEKWVPQAKRRIDLFGIGDLLAIKRGESPLLIQCTSTSNVSARVNKSVSSVTLGVWLGSGGRFVVHGWSKKGKRGERKLWTLTERELDVSDLGGGTDD